MKDTSSEKRSARWCFTHNNPALPDDANWLYNELAGKMCKFIYGLEVGIEGTEHLQGYFECDKRVKLSTIKNWGGIFAKMHLEPAKGNRKQNVAYCTKEDGQKWGNIKSRKARILERYEGVEWRPWQKDILEIMEAPADPRKVHWVYDPKGNAGKSFLMKYIHCKWKVIIGDGKYADVMNQLKEWVEANEDEDPDAVIVDVPRSHAAYFQVRTLEKLKDGLVYSGKYEGGVIELVEPMRAIVFANTLPVLDTLSADRWDIREIRADGTLGTLGTGVWGGATSTEL